MYADGSDKRQVTFGIRASAPSVACDGTLDQRRPIQRAASR